MATGATATTFRVLIDTEIYESVQSLSNPIGTLLSDQEVTLIEPNLGKYFQLSKISYETGGTTKEAFIRSCFLAPAAGNSSPPETYELIGEEVEEPVPNPIKVKDAELETPYAEGKHINVVIDSGFVDMKDIDDNLMDLKLTAISKMVEFYGKNATSTQLNEFIANPFGLIKMGETYFPTRPCKGIVIKFSVRKKYFDAFEDMSFDDFSIRNIHKNFIAINIQGKQFEKSMSDLVKVLGKYNSDVGKFSGSLVGINFDKSGNEVRNFLSNFKKFLSSNNVSLANVGESKFELGFNMETYRLEYVLHFSPYGNFLTVGLKALAAQINATTSKILIAHKDIVSASLGGMNWMDLCNNFLAGEFKIDFSTPSVKSPSLKKPKSQLEADMKRVSADYDDLTIMDSDKNGQLANLKTDPKFKEKASELLLRSRDVVGDNFLANLPEILANVDDLNSLYGLVFDKVSIKDLVDLLMEKMTENLNVPDINEIKLRGIMKALTPNMALGLIEEFIETPQQLSAFSVGVCDLIEISENNIDDILGSFSSIDNPIQFYLIHYKDSSPGVPAGMLADAYVGDLVAKLEENGITDCESLYGAYRNNNFNISDYFQETALKTIICEILTNGLPELTDICVYTPTVSATSITSFPSYGVSSPVLNADIMSFLKSIDASILVKGIDVFIKDMFADAQNYQKQLNIDANASSYVPGTATPDYSGVKFSITPGDLFDRFAKIPKIKIELDKLSLTKKKMLNKVPNVNLDLESKKKDVNFSLPSIKSVNPSFDFSSFEFESIGDIFGQAVESIENAIVDGIEKGLINAFKGILQNVLDSLNMDMPDIDSPDFGGLNMNDLMDASDGTSADIVTSIILDDLKFEIGKFNPDFDSNAVDISGYTPSLSDVKTAFDDMSACLKPLELTRVMKGQFNKKDYENMTSSIKDPNLKQAFNPSAFNRAMEMIADFVDVDMLEELEDAYDNKQVMVAVCKNHGVPYCLRDIKVTLEEKYASLSPAEICDLIDDIVDETKDSLVDAIGNMKENFQDNLPFNEDPCSFMPKPADIPAMDFVNNVAFDAIFNPIELEYKAEAASFPDLMLMSTSPEEYVKCRLYQYDSVPVEVLQDPATGLFDIEYDFISNVMGDDFDKETGAFNQDFSNHYFGPQTPVYYLGNDRNYYQVENLSLIEIDKQNDEYFINRNDTPSVDDNLYVKKATESLRPIPRLKESYIDSGFIIRGYGSTGASGVGMVYSGGGTTGAGAIEEMRNITNARIARGYEIQFPSLSAEATMASEDFTPADLEADDSGDDEIISLLLGEDSSVAGIARSPKIKFDVGATKTTISNSANMTYPSVDALVNPQCVKLDSEYNVETDTGYPYYAKSIQDSIDETQRRLFEEYGLYTGSPFREFLGFYTDGHDAMAQHFIKDEREDCDLIANMTADIAQTMMRAMGESPLFDTNEMLSFLFETEDVNLFKVQEAKGAAKDDFNEDCEFKDDNKSKLKSSSTKQLIYLTFRIYTIDLLMKSCFINSVVYEEEMSDYMIKFIFEYMVQELKREKESYYSVFKDLYSQEYGEDLESKFPDPPKKFKSIVSEIYLDMRSYFSTIFPSAMDGTIRAAVSGMKVFSGTESEYPRELYDTYMYGRNIPNENSRFLIQLLFQRDDGTEVFLNNSTYAERSHDTPIIIRLNYVFDYYNTVNLNVRKNLAEMGGFDSLGTTDESGVSPSTIEYAWLYKHDPVIYSDDDDVYHSAIGQESLQYHAAPAYDLGDYRSSYVNEEKQAYLPIQVYKMRRTKSFLMHYSSREGFWAPHEEPYLVVLPLAETRIDVGSDTYDNFRSEGYQLFRSVQAQNKPYFIDKKEYNYDTFIAMSIAKFVSDSADGSHAAEYSIHDFLKNRMRVDSYIDLIRRTMLVKLQQLKPEVLFAFQDTKNAIRRGIMSLSKEKEVFDYVELETDTTMGDQSQGVGTSPDFSPKAKKMALMTVPMIVKGMAEMFDPNIKVASVIRKAANASGLDIPPPIASLMALPFNVIPLAPGPPITPLGLTYLATSFLEPKERKKLSDLKRGKNINPGADPETGGFIGGSPEELLEARELAAREAYANAEKIHTRIISFAKAWCFMLEQLYDKVVQESFRYTWSAESTDELDIPNHGSYNISWLGDAAEGKDMNISAIVQPAHAGGSVGLDYHVWDVIQAWSDPDKWTHRQSSVDMATQTYDRELEEADFKDFMTKVSLLINNHLTANPNTKTRGAHDMSGDKSLAVQMYNFCRYLSAMEDHTSSTSTNGYSWHRYMGFEKFEELKSFHRGGIKALFGLNRAMAFLAYGISKIMNEAGLSVEIDFTSEVHQPRFEALPAGRRLADTINSPVEGRLVLTHRNMDWHMSAFGGRDDEAWSSEQYWNQYIRDASEVIDNSEGDSDDEYWGTLIIPNFSSVLSHNLNNQAKYHYTGHIPSESTYDAAESQGTYRSAVKTMNTVFYSESQLFFKNTGQHGQNGSHSPKGVGIDKFFKKMKDESLFDMLVTAYMERAERTTDGFQEADATEGESLQASGTSFGEME